MVERALHQPLFRPGFGRPCLPKTAGANRNISPGRTARGQRISSHASTDDATRNRQAAIHQQPAWSPDAVCRPLRSRGLPPEGGRGFGFIDMERLGVEPCPAYAFIASAETVTDGDSKLCFPGEEILQIQWCLHGVTPRPL